MFLNINRQLLPQEAAAVPHDNRAFRYGYGLFETMLFEDGHIALEDLHWARLFAGMAQLHFEIPKHFTPDALGEEVVRTVHKNRLEALCRVRLQVWPGGGGLYDAGSFAPDFMIECFPLQKELAGLNENGLTAGIASGIAKSMDSLANLKSCNALIYSLAAREVKMNKWNDAFILNTAGRVAETTISNFFWVKKGIICTPALSEGCIAGVMRQHLVQMANAKNIVIAEEKITIGELKEADEIFTTNSIRKVKWIRNLDNQCFTNEVSSQIAGWL